MGFETMGNVAGSLLIALLIVAAAQDLQTREVSGWLTLPPLLATVAWRAATGGWVLLAAFIVIALFSERIVCRGRGPALAALMAGLVAVSYVLPGSPAYWTLLGWLAAWLLWEFNVIGGADVKLMMLLVAVYPYPSMFFLILLAKLVAGLIVPAALYGRSVAKRLFSVALLVLVARQMPDRETLEREGLPAVFVYTMAGVGYVLVFATRCPASGGAGSPESALALGGIQTWGALVIAFALATLPIALFLRSVACLHPAPAGRPAGLRSVPCLHPAPAGPSAGLRSILAHGLQANPEQSRGTRPAGLAHRALQGSQKGAAQVGLDEEL